MKEMNRIFPLRDNSGHMFGLITFYLGNGNPDKYVRDDMWKVLQDEGEKGDTVYVDQVLCDKDTNHFKYSFKIWKQFKSFLKQYKNIKSIRWNRFKDKKHYIFRKEI